MDDRSSRMGDVTDEPRHAAPPPPTVSPTFESVFVTEYKRMVALAAAVSGRRADAEDIAAEAMQRLQLNWSRVADYERPGAWVRRATINLALSRRRRISAEARALVRLGGPGESVLPPSTAEHEPVWAAVAKLPGKQRAAVALHYLEDRPIDEIADVLACSPSTARVHLHRGRAALRDQLQSMNPTETER